jgi:prevent-host-death family protein
MYEFVYAELVHDNLKDMSASDRSQVLDKIEEQLNQEPTQITRNKKMLVGLTPPWEAEGPVWQLRIGKFRVFCEVNEVDSWVLIRAIREKPPQDYRGDSVKIVNINDAELQDYVKEAQRGGVLITRNGKPVAVLVGVKGMDLEQVELSYSPKFWELIKKARGQKTITRHELEKRLARK